MADSRVYVSDEFFVYKGESKKVGNSLYQCLNCPVNLKKRDGSPMYYSCSDISRGNLRDHMKAKHLGKLESFDCACKVVSKRKREDESDSTLRQSS